MGNLLTTHKTNKPKPKYDQNYYSLPVGNLVFKNVDVTSPLPAKTAITHAPKLSTANLLTANVKQQSFNQKKKVKSKIYTLNAYQSPILNFTNTPTFTSTFRFSICHVEYFSLGCDTNRLLQLAFTLLPENIPQSNNDPSHFMYVQPFRFNANLLLHSSQNNIKITRNQDKFKPPHNQHRVDSAGGSNGGGGGCGGARAGADIYDTSGNTGGVGTAGRCGLKQFIFGAVFGTPGQPLLESREHATKEKSLVTSVLMRLSIVGLHVFRSYVHRFAPGHEYHFRHSSGRTQCSDFRRDQAAALWARWTPWRGSPQSAPPAGAPPKRVPSDLADALEMRLSLPDTSQQGEGVVSSKIRLNDDQADAETFSSEENQRNGEVADGSTAWAGTQDSRSRR